MKKNNIEKLKKAALILSLFFFIAVLLVSGYKFLCGIDNRFAVFGDGKDGSIEKINYNGKDYKYNHNTEAVLVIGIDKFDNSYVADETVFRNDEQSDLDLLLVLDHSKKTMSLLHINRDTMVSIDTYGVNGAINGKRTAQLALSHTYGNGGEKSCLNTCTSVSRLLKNVTVNKYIALNMGAVSTFNDLIGGVKVNVLNDFSGIDDSLVLGQDVVLKGSQALTYVRARYGVGDETNATRMLRQQQYLESFYQTAAKAYADNPDLSKTVAEKLTGDCITNCSVSKLQKLTENIAEYSYSGILSLEGEYKVTDHMEFYPDDDLLTQTVLKLFYK